MRGFYRHPQCSVECCIEAFSIVDEIDNQATSTDSTDWGSTLQHEGNIQTSDVTEVVCEISIAEVTGCNEEEEDIGRSNADMIKNGEKKKM